jgi:anti-anti-sigma factor
MPPISTALKISKTRSNVFMIQNPTMPPKAAIGSLLYSPFKVRSLAAFDKRRQHRYNPGRIDVGAPMTTHSATRSFHLHTYRATDQAMIVECHGKLTLEHAPQLRNKVRTLIPQEKRVVLDLKEVPFMDSAGLGTLVTLYVSCRTRGCKLELINVGAALRTLLGMTNLLSLFEHAGRFGGKMP